jgi:amino acid transporter
VLFLLQAAAFAFCYRDVRWSVGIVLSVTAASAALVCVLCFMIAIGRTMDHAPRYLNASTIGTIVAHANGMNRKAASSSLHVLAQLNGNGSGSGNYSHLLLPVRDPAVPIPATAGGFFSGLVLALTMFAGFESAAVLGGEAESPRVVVPRAVSLTVLCCTVFFWLVAMSLTLGYDQTGEWAADTSPLTTMATRWGFVGLPTAMYSSVIFDGWAGNVACITVVSRLCVSLSRIGFLPRCCGRLHPTHRSPVVAAAAVCALVVSSTVLCEAAGSRICTVSSLFSFCLSVSGILLQVCYAAVAISAACYFPYENNRHTPARAIAVAASAIPLVAVGAAFYAATSDFVSAAAIVVATVWVAACGLVVAVAPAWVVVALPAGDDSETGDGGAGGGSGGGESNGGDEIEVASRGGAEGEEDAANVGEGEDAAAWSEYAESLAHATTEETQRSSERASLLSVN